MAHIEPLLHLAREKNIPVFYTESARRSARLAERMDDLRQTYGRTKRGEPVTEADWLRNRRA